MYIWSKIIQICKHCRYFTTNSSSGLYCSKWRIWKSQCCACYSWRIYYINREKIWFLQDTLYYTTKKQSLHHFSRYYKSCQWRVYKLAKSFWWWKDTLYISFHAPIYQIWGELRSPRPRPGMERQWRGISYNRNSHLIWNLHLIVN